MRFFARPNSFRNLEGIDTPMFLGCVVKWGNDRE